MGTVRAHIREDIRVVACLHELRAERKENWTYRLWKGSSSKPKFVVSELASCHVLTFWSSVEPHVLDEIATRHIPRNTPRLRLKACREIVPDTGACVARKVQQHSDMQATSRQPRTSESETPGKSVEIAGPGTKPTTSAGPRAAIWSERALYVPK